MPSAFGDALTVIVSCFGVTVSVTARAALRWLVVVSLKLMLLT
jgi:hypothetical protein